MIHNKAKKAAEWYTKNRIYYIALAKKVETIVRELLEFNKINYHSVSCRAKSVESYRKKASKEKYKVPQSEIMDIAGVRVITYTNYDAKKVSEIIQEAFEIYPEYSVDKAEELGIDRVGYRGIHYIANLGKDRLKLPENQIFKGFVFEIQIRSILQHAWAEFEHDRNYKFAGILPKELGRRLSLLAANLESTDGEFDRLSKDIDKYAGDVLRKAKLGDLSTIINSTSLRAYANKKFKPLLKLGVEPYSPYDDEIIEELSLMEINTLEELESITPGDFVKRESNYFPSWIIGSIVGVIRNILMIHDADSYFKKAWRRRWQGLDRDAISLAESYGVGLLKYAKQYNLDVIP